MVFSMVSGVLDGSVATNANYRYEGIWRNQVGKTPRGSKKLPQSSPAPPGGGISRPGTAGSYSDLNGSESENGENGHPPQRGGYHRRHRFESAEDGAENETEGFGVHAPRTPLKFRTGPGDISDRLAGLHNLSALQASNYDGPEGRNDRIKRPASPVRGRSGRWGQRPAPKTTDLNHAPGGITPGHLTRREPTPPPPAAEIPPEPTYSLSDLQEALPSLKEPHSAREAAGLPPEITPRSADEEDDEKKKKEKEKKKKKK